VLPLNNDLTPTLRLTLYCHNHCSQLSQQAFYQMAVRRFAATPRLELAAAVDVQQFARAALDLPEAEWTPQDG
jgi:hypothetical protein